MVTQGPSPSVEDSKEAWKIASDMSVIFGEFSDGLRRGSEHGGVGQALVGTDNGAYFLRNGKGEHKVMSGQVAFHLSFQPLPCLMMLTGGAVAISTGFIDDMRLCTVLTLIDGNAG